MYGEMVVEFCKRSARPDNILMMCSSYILVSWTTVFCYFVFDPQDNVNVFLKACGKLGLNESQLFHPGDLQDLSTRVMLRYCQAQSGNLAKALWAPAMWGKVLTKRLKPSCVCFQWFLSFVLFECTCTVNQCYWNTSEYVSLYCAVGFECFLRKYSEIVKVKLVIVERWWTCWRWWWVWGLF